MNTAIVSGRRALGVQPSCCGRARKNRLKPVLQARAWLLILICTLLAGCTPRIHRRDLPVAIVEGETYLARTQNADGSWGTGTQSNGNEVICEVPGSHDSFRTATTALCVMALQHTKQTAAHDRGVRYLIEQGRVGRDNNMLILNFWAHAYVIQALARESYTNHDPRLAQTVDWHIDRLDRYQTLTGGWNYYDFNAGTQHPSSGSTSFCAGAGLMALWEARQAGFAVPQPMVDRAVRRLQEMHLPNGAYLYGLDLQYHPQLPADLPRGSVGRTQLCNLALKTWHSPHISEADCQSGLHDFFANHVFLEMGRKTPYPHSSWYQTSGYYYYFDHYYAACLIAQLPPGQARAMAHQLQEIILPLQEPDGSWWDYAMWDYHKPYGTALALLALQQLSRWTIRFL